MSRYDKSPNQAMIILGRYDMSKNAIQNIIAAALCHAMISLQIKL